MFFLDIIPINTYIGYKKWMNERMHEKMEYDDDDCVVYYADDDDDDNDDDGYDNDNYDCKHNNK